MIDLTSPFIKICGLRELEHAKVAAESGASALGFILAPSRRQVTPSLVRDVKRQLREAGIQTPVVGVVVNLAGSDLIEIVEQADIDFVQLAGDELPGQLPKLPVKIIKALRFSPETSLDDARLAVESWLGHPQNAGFVHVDSFVPGAYGGSGHTGDWGLAASLASGYPILLAGGLTPENVAEAITTVQPFGVDVASGVEEDGQKSAPRIQSFVCASREAFEVRTGSASSAR